MNFSKYHGTGNDFILIDNRSDSFHKDHKRIAHYCHRRFGIGADGLILLENPLHPKADFSMVYYNADGGESTMCGNGGRCIVKFAQSLGIIDNKAVFTAVDGEHEAHIKDEVVALKMTDIHRFKKLDTAFYVDSGSPHYIRFVDQVDQMDIAKEGYRIRNSKAFKQAGVNVNFVEMGDAVHQIRTYERGVEAETYSCGTGVTAAAIAVFLSDNQRGTHIKFDTLGGSLAVDFEPHSDKFKNIWLTGPAMHIFAGTI